MQSRSRYLASLALVVAWAGCAAPVDTQVADRVAIRALIDRVHDALVHHEWDTIPPLLTDDAVWEALPTPSGPGTLPTGWRFVGRDAIAGALSSSVNRVEVLAQVISPVVIELEGPDHASARTTMSELLRFVETGAGVHIVGTYADRFVKKDGVWRVASRRFRLRYEDDVAAPERIHPVTAPASP